MTGRLELADKDFKAAILSISEDLKEKFVQITTTDKVYQQRNKKYFKNQKEILQSKQLKFLNPLEELNNKLETTEERISTL